MGFETGRAVQRAGELHRYTAFTIMRDHPIVVLLGVFLTGATIAYLLGVEPLRDRLDQQKEEVEMLREQAVGTASPTTPDHETVPPLSAPNGQPDEMMQTFQSQAYDCLMPSTSECSVQSTNYEDVTFYVDAVRVENGKMIWNISFWNRGNRGASMAMGVRSMTGESNSYMSDDAGNQYKIKRMIPKNFLSQNIPTGVRNEGQLEFDAPDAEAEVFTLHLNIWTFGFHQLRLPSPTVAVKLHIDPA